MREKDFGWGGRRLAAGRRAWCGWRGTVLKRKEKEGGGGGGEQRVVGALLIPVCADWAKRGGPPPPPASSPRERDGAMAVGVAGARKRQSSDRRQILEMRSPLTRRCTD